MMKYSDTTTVIDGVKYVVLEMRKPRKAERTWRSETGHIFNYAGLSGRGLRKGWSTKSNVVGV
jgi:hypothetical protein